MAFKRIERERRRADKDAMTDKERKQFRRTNLELLELRMDALKIRVDDEIHQPIIRFQRALKDMIQWGDLDLGVTEEADNASLPSPARKVNNIRNNRHQVTATTENWDRHQHASRRKVTSVEAISRNKLHRKRRKSQRRKKVSPLSETITSTNRDVSEHAEEFGSDDEVKRDEIYSSQQSINVVGFIGEFDDFDDDIGQSGLDTNTSRRRFSSKPVMVDKSASRLTHQRYRSIGDRMESFFDAQSHRVDYAERPKELDRRHYRTSLNEKHAFRSSNPNHSFNIRHREERGYEEITTDQDIRNSSGIRASRICENSHQMENERTFSNPGIPNLLLPDNLYEELSRTLPRAEIGRTSISDSDTYIELDEVCKRILEFYPNRLQSCRRLLPSLLNSFVADPNENQKIRIVKALQTFLSIFQSKYSTFTELLWFNPQEACFQIECWSVIFRLIHRKIHLKLDEEDGEVYQVFGKKDRLSDHILLMMIDVLYSQILWEEWGCARRDPEVISCLSSLRDGISAVVPLLSKVPFLLTQKVGHPRWYRSNYSSTVRYYVSAVVPESHRQFISSGIVLETPGNNCRLMQWKRGLPRKEIDALWSVLGFMANSNLSPTAKDFRQTIRLISSMMHYNRGTLPKITSQLPPSKKQLDICSKEINWIRILLDSECPHNHTNEETDKFVLNLVEKAVTLQSQDIHLKEKPEVKVGVIKQALVKLWKSSMPATVVTNAFDHMINAKYCVNLLSALFMRNEQNEAWCLTPCSNLLQNCVALIATYEKKIISKKLRWKAFFNSLNQLVNKFYEQAKLLSSKETEEGNLQSDFGAAFASNFPASSLETSFDNTVRAFLSEAVCFLLLSSIAARKDSNVRANAINIGLDRAFIEKVSFVSCRHYFLFFGLTFECLAPSCGQYRPTPR